MSHSKKEEEIEDIKVLEFHIDKSVKILIELQREIRKQVVSKSRVKNSFIKVNKVCSYVLKEML